MLSALAFWGLNNTVCSSANFSANPPIAPGWRKAALIAAADSELALSATLDAASTISAAFSASREKVFASDLAAR